MVSPAGTVAVAADAPFRTTKTDLAALLTAHGIEMVGAEIERGRVRFDFDNQDGRAGQLAREHAISGVEINSRGFTSALRSVEDTMWSIRREAGLAK